MITTMNKCLVSLSKLLDKPLLFLKVSYFFASVQLYGVVLLTLTVHCSKKNMEKIVHNIIKECSMCDCMITSHEKTTNAAC